MPVRPYGGAARKGAHTVNRNSRRRLLALSAAGLVALTAGCAGGSSSGGSGKQTVVFWEFDNSKPTLNAYHQAISAFEKKNPDITVDMQVVPWSEQQQKITAALTTGALPDVSMLGNDVVAQYAHQGSLQPLDSYIKKWSAQEGQDVTADYWPGDKLYYHLNGHWYGAPVADETRMVYYRTDLFKKAGLDPSKPPTTWAELQADAVKLKKVTKTPLVLPMSKDYDTVQIFMSVYLGYGARLLQNGKCAADTPAFKQALSYYTGLAKKGLTPADAAMYDGDKVSSVFVSGQGAMEIAGPSDWQTLQENASLKGKVGIASIPAGPSGQYGFLGGWPLVMWKTSQHKDAAAKWIEFATSPKGGLNTIAKVSGILPGRKSLTNQAPWNTAPMSSFASQLTKAQPYQYPDPEIPQMGQIETSTVQAAVQRVATGQQSVDTSTAQMCSEINKIVAGK
jgi:ABC-type glycerol-3-phosphate transport system substrate-binding protein